MSDEFTPALDIARRLVAAGVPVFVASPCLDTCTSRKHKPGEGTGRTGYHLPDKWETSTTGGNQVDRWRPGWALCAVMGHVVDLVDVDPRNGGDATMAGLQSAGAWPRSYGLAATPSGGIHSFIAPLRVHSRDGVAAGLDVKSGAEDGGGRGFAFIAPTVRRSKTTGELAPYRWMVEPDLTDMDGDDSGAPLADMVAAKRAGRPSGGDHFDWDEFAHQPGPWEDIAATLADNPRRVAVFKFAAALRGRGGWRGADALEYMRVRIWPLIDQGKGGHPFPWEEFADNVASAFTRYEDGQPEGEASTPAEDQPEPPRRIVLVPASSIVPRRVEWLWTDRIPLGELTLTPGRAGIGKSTYHAWVIAQITRGVLPGVHYGTPRSCIIAAAEDSWARTIVPRLIAAGADLDRVFRVDVLAADSVNARLVLPADCVLLAEQIKVHDVALVSLDPLMSVIHAGIDTHRNSDVRTVLEPLSRLADTTGAVFLGNAHFNKSGGTDPLNLITGSAAFGEVIRAALGFARDPDDGSFVLSQIKNNLGRLDLPSLGYVVENATVETKDGTADVGRFRLLGETERSVADILGDRGDSGEPGERDQAAEWLTGYLIDQGGEASFGDLAKAARANGHAERTLRRAATRAGVQITSSGFPRRTVWALDTTVRPQSGQWGHPHETGRTGPTVAALDETGGPGDE